MTVGYDEPEALLTSVSVVVRVDTCVVVVVWGLVVGKVTAPNATPMMSAIIATPIIVRSPKASEVKQW
jgi:hypothetical protein